VVGYFISSPTLAPPLACALSAITAAKLQRNRIIEALIWNLSLAAFAAGIVYYIKQMFL